GAFAHGAQADVPRERAGGVEAGAVVAHLDAEDAGTGGQAHGRLRRARVLDDVVQRLLRDAVHRLLHRQRRLRLIAHLRGDLDAEAGLRGRDLFLDRRDEALGLERLRTEL